MARFCAGLSASCAADALGASSAPAFCAAASGTTAKDASCDDGYRKDGAAAHVALRLSCVAPVLGFKVPEDSAGATGAASSCALLLPACLFPKTRQLSPCSS